MRSIVAVSLALLFLAPAGNAALQAPRKGQATFETTLVRQINAIRRDRGLRPLTTSSKLNAAAAQHTWEMGTKGYFQHESFDSTSFWKRIERWYPSRGWRSWSVGENLLFDSPDSTPNETLALWLQSRPHRANLLSRTWREVGLSAVRFQSAPGEFEDGPVLLVTADFGVRR